VFREGWTDNADVMSYLYTGTPALKTDFTRTGKRTYKGAINDGINSITRYYINNFTDGHYHDSLDVATCKLTCKSEFKTRRKIFTPIKFTMLMIIMLTVLSHLAMERFTNQIIVPNVTELTLKHQALHYVTVGFTFLAGLYYIINNGRSFIDDCSRYV